MATSTQRTFNRLHNTVCHKVVKPQNGRSGRRSPVPSLALTQEVPAPKLTQVYPQTDIRSLQINAHPCQHKFQAKWSEWSKVSQRRYTFSSNPLIWQAVHSPRKVSREALTAASSGSLKYSILRPGSRSKSLALMRPRSAASGNSSNSFAVASSQSILSHCLLCDFQLAATVTSLEEMDSKEVQVSYLVSSLESPGGGQWLNVSELLPSLHYIPQPHNRNGHETFYRTSRFCSVAFLCVPCQTQAGCSGSWSKPRTKRVQAVLGLLRRSQSNLLQFSPDCSSLNTCQSRCAFANHSAVLLVGVLDPQCKCRS